MGVWLLLRGLQVTDCTPLIFGCAEQGLAESSAIALQISDCTPLIFGTVKIDLNANRIHVADIGLHSVDFRTPGFESASSSSMLQISDCTPLIFG